MTPAPLIPVLNLSTDTDRQRVESLLARLRLDPRDVALNRGERARAVAAVNAILADVADRGDDAIVQSSQKFDDPHFTAAQIRVTPEEMKDAAARVPADQLAALRRSIAQVKEYQVNILPPRGPPSFAKVSSSASASLPSTPPASTSPVEKPPTPPA